VNEVLSDVWFFRHQYRPIPDNMVEFKDHFDLDYVRAFVDDLNYYDNSVLFHNYKFTEYDDEQYRTIARSNPERRPQFHQLIDKTVVWGDLCLYNRVFETFRSRIE
jgi:hypothetical protein